MPSTTVTTERRWDAAARSELQLLAASFELQLDEHAEHFVLRSAAADAEDDVARVVARVAKQNARDGLAGLKAVARYVDAAAIPAAEAEPHRQPAHVHQLAPLLMKPFHLHGGTIHVAGWVWERRPFLRLTLLPQHAADAVPPHRWYGLDGKPLASEKVARLGLDDLQPLPRRLRDGDVDNLRSWIHSEAASGTDAVIAVVAWCSWISGKLQLAFPSGSAHVAFEGWAAEFGSGHRRVEPYRCPQTGESDYEVLILDDGTITVPAATGRCEQTGRRVLRSRLRRCAITGMTCSETELVQCPISSEWGLQEKMARCRWCDRQVLPLCAPQGRCDQCADLRPVVAGDAVAGALAAVADRLEGWSRQRGRMLGDLVIVVGRQRTSERLLVYDRAAGRVVRGGQRRMPWGSWRIEEQGEDEPVK